MGWVMEVQICLMWLSCMEKCSGSGFSLTNHAVHLTVAHGSSVHCLTMGEEVGMSPESKWWRSLEDWSAPTTWILSLRVSLNGTCLNMSWVLGLTVPFIDWSSSKWMPPRRVGRPRHRQTHLLHHYSIKLDVYLLTYPRLRGRTCFQA